MGLFSCHKKSSILVTEFEPNITEPRLFTNDELAAATSDYSSAAFLGRGSHCSVYRATLDGGALLAAVKRPTPSDEDSVNHHTNNEIFILSSVPYSNLLVNLCGCTPPSLTNPSAAVVELMTGGSLHDLLHHPFKPPPAWPQRFRLALRAAEAVAHLHSLESPVIHRDIKTANILIDGSGNARLGDFGLAVKLPSAAKPAGTIGYIDPTYISAKDISFKVDVYSFGVVLLEVVSGRRAIDVQSPGSGGMGDNADSGGENRRGSGWEGESRRCWRSEGGGGAGDEVRVSSGGEQAVHGRGGGTVARRREKSEVATCQVAAASPPRCCVVKATPSCRCH